MAMNQIITRLLDYIYAHKCTSFTRVLITFLLCTNSFVLPVMAVHTLSTWKTLYLLKTAEVTHLSSVKSPKTSG